MGQLTPKMAQIEAYIYMLDFQVLKLCLFIKNISKNGPEVTENLEILSKWAKIRVFFNFEGQNRGQKYVQLTWEWF